MAGDGRADAIISGGYSSVHMVAELTATDLIGLGFLPGNAKKMASYLGSEPASRPEPYLSVCSAVIDDCTSRTFTNIRAVARTGWHDENVR